MEAGREAGREPRPGAARAPRRSPLPCTSPGSAAGSPGRPGPYLHVADDGLEEPSERATFLLDHRLHFPRPADGRRTRTPLRLRCSATEKRDPRSHLTGTRRHGDGRAKTTSAPLRLKTAASKNVKIREEKLKKGRSAEGATRSARPRCGAPCGPAPRCPPAPGQHRSPSLWDRRALEEAREAIKTTDSVIYRERRDRVLSPTARSAAQRSAKQAEGCSPDPPPARSTAPAALRRRIRPSPPPPPAAAAPQPDPAPLRQRLGPTCLPRAPLYRGFASRCRRVVPPVPPVPPAGSSAAGRNAFPLILGAIALSDAVSGVCRAGCPPRPTWAGNDRIVACSESEGTHKDTHKGPIR